MFVCAFDFKKITLMVEEGNAKKRQLENVCAEHVCMFCMYT